MGKKYSNFLFNAIAPIYALFYKSQKKSFRRVISGVACDLDLSTFDTVLDVGCGTGALCSVLREKGLSVTGIDPAEKMLRIARKQQENRDITFMSADVVETLPFADKTFDISMASFVAHGMLKSDRQRMYAEMSRVTKDRVVIYDYNANRSWVISLVEWFERGDYFHFIKVAEDEMRNCVAEMNACFQDVRVVDVDKRAAWYICTPQ